MEPKRDARSPLDVLPVKTEQPSTLGSIMEDIEISRRAERGSKNAFLAVFAKAPAVDEPKRNRRA